MRRFCQRLQVNFKGKVENWVLGVIERELDVNEMRGGAVGQFVPIHSFLFSATGRLLFANMKAGDKLQAEGVRIAG